MALVLVLILAPASQAQTDAGAALPAASQNNDASIRNEAAQNEGWAVCNETSFYLRLATATLIDGNMTPKGWERMRPGQCTGVVAPRGTPRYVFAESDVLHLGGVREWAGTVPLCSSAQDFTADATLACNLQNLESRKYLQIDPNDPRTVFIEPDNYGNKAEIAGLQRLLRDNGYSISRIDGIMGRRTARTLKKFVKEQGLAAKASNADKLDALAETAFARQSDVGLTLCNNSSHNIWSSVAFRKDGVWESRGWWPISEGGCLRPFTNSLVNAQVHFYALQETPPTIIDDINNPDAKPIDNPDKKLRNTAAKPAQFCIAEAKFSALGREYCLDKGYTVANFRPVPTDKDGQKIVVSDADFVAATVAGLRR